ncbi:MAG: OmpH family outer membrane protein [Flavobacteriaceae bacterium]|nr:OmpH family outer membrane protein [Flavobacteriaceae bacterium]
MKHFKNLLFITIITLSFNTIQAQDKFGYIDTQELVTALPEFKNMNTELEKLNKTQMADLKASSDALQATAQKYQAEAATQTDAENQKRQIELQESQQRLANADKAGQQALQSKQQELLEPILERVNKAIEDISAANGYTFVFDRSTLIIAKGTDLMPLVKAKLGL